MIDLTQETLLTIPQAARLIPSGGKAGHIHLSTLWRWILKGTGARKLESIKVGGRTFTSAEALQRFAEAREKPEPEAVSPSRTSQETLFELKEARLIPGAPCES